MTENASFFKILLAVGEYEPNNNNNGGECFILKKEENKIKIVFGIVPSPNTLNILCMRM